MNDKIEDKKYLVRNKAGMEERIRKFEVEEEEEEEDKGQETDAGEHDETTSEESDEEDTEGIVDALLAEYTRG